MRSISIEFKGKNIQDLPHLAWPDVLWIGQSGTSCAELGWRKGLHHSYNPKHCLLLAPTSVWHFICFWLHRDFRYYQEPEAERLSHPKTHMQKQRDDLTRSTSEMLRLHRTFLHPSYPHGHILYRPKPYPHQSHNFSECPPKCRRQRQQGTEPRAPGDPPSCLPPPQLCSHNTSQLHHSSVLLYINRLNRANYTHPLPLSAGFRASTARPEISSDKWDGRGGSKKHTQSH